MTKTRIHVRAGSQAAGLERGEAEDRDPGVGDDRVADDVLEVVLDPGGERSRGRRSRRRPRRSAPARRRAAGASGATDWSTQARATTANAAGPQAMSIGSVTSGAASARRAAQKWNGIAPNRIATATANPR